MNICLFGGTFDPIHRGHLAIARNAARQFHLDQVLFVPSEAPPHKLKRPLTPFAHRYAMLTLATAGEKRFLPSLLESREELARDRRRFAYTADTLRTLRGSLKKSDRLFFLIGVDAFLEIAAWHQPEVVLTSCEFIIASRPGFPLTEVASALPNCLQPAARLALAGRRSTSRSHLVLPGVRLHLLAGVHCEASSTEIRAAAQRGRGLRKLVPESVAGYIEKMRLYRR